MQNFNYKEFAFKNASKDNSETVALFQCSKSETEIFYMNASGDIFPFNSFGFCRECEKPFHTSALHGADTFSEWPIQYEGRMCEECFRKPDEETKVTKEEQKILDTEPDYDE